MAVLGRDGLHREDESIDRLRQLGRILAGGRAGPHTDWDGIAALAGYQGVAPLLFWRLEQGLQVIGSGGDAPQAVMEALRADLHAATVHGMLAERQLATVLGTLSAAGVPAMVIKGAAAGAYYPDPVLRQYGDLDIMVPQTQLEAAERALNGIGYECVASKAWWLDRFHHLPPMTSENGTLLVELHWRLDYQEHKGRLPTDDLWARAVPWTVQDQPALRLEDADAVLYLCRHAVVQHRVHGALRSLCDLIHITRGWGQGEWEMLVQRATDYALTRPVYLMLVLAEQSLNLAIPAELVASLRPSGSMPEPEELLRWLVKPEDATPARVSLGAVQAIAQGSPAERLQRLMGSLFLPREGMAMVYDVPQDSPRIWLTYLWRPIDLMGRYGRSAWRTLRRERGAQELWQQEVWLERWLTGDAHSEEMEDGGAVTT